MLVKIFNQEICSFYIKALEAHVSIGGDLLEDVVILNSFHLINLSDLSNTDKHRVMYQYDHKSRTIEPKINYATDEAMMDDMIEFTRDMYHEIKCGIKSSDGERDFITTPINRFFVTISGETYVFIEDDFYKIDYVYNGNLYDLYDTGIKYTVDGLNPECFSMVPTIEGMEACNKFITDNNIYNGNNIIIYVDFEEEKEN